MFKVGERKLLIKVLHSRINDLEKFITNNKKTTEGNYPYITPEIKEKRTKHIARMEHEKEKLIKMIEKLEQ